MDGLRTLIIERIRDTGCKDNWLLDVYYHLTNNGVPADDALGAMERFVDEAVAMKQTLEVVK